jgi:hypothetical protein
MGKTTGTLRKFTVEGISYDVMADVDVKEIFTKYENSAIPTSGNAMMKKVKRVPSREGFVLATSGDEREELKAFAESIDNLKFSYTNMAGDTYKCSGQMEIEENSTADSRTTVNVFPEDDWTKF